MSKRIDQALSVVEKTVELIRSELQSTGFVSLDHADTFCKQATHQTATQFGVGYSTISSKCIGEIGFKGKKDFFCAVIDFLTNKNHKLRSALINHDCADDGEWYINRRLDALL